jgi:putative transposase
VAWYRRNYVPGGTYFFTVVTHDRRPILTTDLARPIFHDVIAAVLKDRPFKIVAVVLLPDHLHTVWTLPADDAGYSRRWSGIKEEFTRQFLRAGGTEGPITASRVRRRERGVWQRRFWEYTVRDEDDLIRCVDYIHWNPVKHGLVKSPRDYPWSSFHRFVESGDYPPDWGGTPPPEIPGAEWE